MSDETLVQKQVRLVLERQCRELADLLKTKVPAGVGFALFLFDFGEKGNTAYVSTAQRDDMIKLIWEWLDHQDANHPREGWKRFAEFVCELARVLEFEGEPAPQALLDECAEMVEGAKGANAYVAMIDKVTGYGGPADLDALLEHCKQLAARAGKTP
jgi:hypothetical protein